MVKPTKVVLKVEEGMDPAEILCTTYQMRNMYQQFSDAIAGPLDIMNYHQHHYAAIACGSNERILDVCCGRCLMLPLLRRIRPKIDRYVGVDISANNFAESTRWAGGRNIKALRMAPNIFGNGDPYYPFPVYFVESNVAEMAEPLWAQKHAPFDTIIYTAAIEHMQRDAGAQSLKECFAVLKPGGKFILSSPNTSDKADPYDTQYAAHLYEWPRTELKGAVEDAGFTIQEEFGLVAKVTGYEAKLRRHYPELVEVFAEFKKYMPSAWLYATFPVITPKIADEILFLCTK